MSKKVVWLISSCLIVMMLVVTSCGTAVVEEEEAPVVEEEEAPPEISKTVLYSDDFSDDTSGWDTYDDEDGWVHYEKGRLHVLNYTSSEWDTVSHAHQHFADFILEVEMKLVAGSDDNFQTIDARFKDAENTYSFGISADGYYAILAIVEDSVHTLVEPTRSIYIRQGRDATNLVRVECVGNTLKLSVNGYLLQEVTDTHFHEGDIGLDAVSYAGTSTEVAFDNIMVTAP